MNKQKEQACLGCKGYDKGLHSKDLQHDEEDIRYRVMNVIHQFNPTSAITRYLM